VGENKTAFAMTSRFEKLGNHLLEHSSWLLKHCDALAKEESPYWDCWWPGLEKMSRESAAEIDAAARLLAVGRLSKPPPPQICAFLVLRLQMAAGVIQSLEDDDGATKAISFPKSIDEMPDSEMAEWLLTDFGHRFGKHIWQWVGYWEFDMWKLSHDEPRPHRLSDDQIVT
jgi:hypothetical protein